ncbi:MAG TPA: GRAM domain-containing protein [Candidatus Nanoarchaeia archaeon]|nr:GRAM domain-containing protein [Candidatus Nanoarchaeia archaeon]
MVLSLKKNEQILIDRGANLFKGMEAVGGRLKITNQRLIFEPHAINIQKQILKVPLNQIKEVKSRNTLGTVPNGIAIKLASSQEYKLVVWKRKELIELINRKK